MLGLRLILQKLRTVLIYAKNSTNFVCMVTSTLQRQCYYIVYTLMKLLAAMIFLHILIMSKALGAPHYNQQID